MAALGGVLLQGKVSRMMSRVDGKPVLKPNRPLVLKDTVANRKPKKGEASCITEMSLMMACWKQSNFVDGLCTNEIQQFYTCVAKAQASRRTEAQQSSSQPGRMTPRQATSLLKRFPTQRSEV